MLKIYKIINQNDNDTYFAVVVIHVFLFLVDDVDENHQTATSATHTLPLSLLNKHTHYTH